MTVEEMRERRKAGGKQGTYQAIANDAGISKQRVHELVNFGTEELAAKRRAKYRKMKNK